MKDNDEKTLFSFAHAARRLGVRTETLRAAAARGQVAVVELNKRLLVPRAEVIRLSGGALK